MEDLFKLPVLGSVGEDGRLHLTDAGKRLLAGGERVEITGDGPDFDTPAIPDEDAVNRVMAMDQLADALMDALAVFAEAVPADGDWRSREIATILGRIRADAIALYGLACEARRE